MEQMNDDELKRYWLAFPGSSVTSTADLPEFATSGHAMLSLIEALEAHGFHYEITTQKVRLSFPGHRGSWEVRRATTPSLPHAIAEAALAALRSQEEGVQG
jgi:hypothetical protein